MILLSTKEEFQFVCTSVSRYCWRYWLLCIYVACVRLAIFHRLNGLFFGLNYQKNIRIFIMQFTFQKETKKKRTHIKAIHHTAWHIYTLSLLQGKTKQSNAKGEARQQREREKKNWINRRLQFIELGGAQTTRNLLEPCSWQTSAWLFPIDILILNARLFGIIYLVRQQNWKQNKYI